MVRMATRVLLPGAALILLGSVAVRPARAETPDYVYRTLDKAKKTARSIDEQVAVLINLAWPKDGGGDPLVRAAARKDLAGYGTHAMPGIRRAIPRLDPLYQADLTAVLVEARYNQPAGMPPDFLPGLESAIWYGSIDAQRIALNEIKRYEFPPAVLGSIDAAYAHPQLMRYVIRSLGVMGDQRAQTFVSKVLLSGPDRLKETAAVALTKLGPGAVNVVREAAESENAAVRQAAMRALLPLTDIDDLSLLHEYHTSRTDDDPALIESVRQRAMELEHEYEEEQVGTASSPLEE